MVRPSYFLASPCTFIHWLLLTLLTQISTPIHLSIHPKLSRFSLKVYFPKVYFSKVYLSKVFFCEMYPTCVSSKLCEFIWDLAVIVYSFNKCQSNILICTTDPWQFSICSHQLVIQYVLISVIFCNLLAMMISPIHWKL